MMQSIEGTPVVEIPRVASEKPGAVSRRSGLRRKLGPQIGWGSLFIAPFLLAFAAFTLVPNVQSVILSFQKYQGFGEASWVGTDNYASLLAYPVFWQSLWNTVFYWFVHAAILIPLSFLLATVVTSRGLRGRQFWQAIIFLPQVMSIVAVTLVFQVMFSTHNGVINTIFGTDIPWLTDMGIARWVVILMLVWQGLGFWFVVFAAGLTSIDVELTEAATVDGAGAVRRVFSITLPLMRNMILFALVMSAIGGMALYTQPNVLLQGGAVGAPADAAPLSNLVVTGLLSGNYGTSAAAGWMLFILTIAVSGILFGIDRIIKVGRVD